MYRFSSKIICCFIAVCQPILVLAQINSENRYELYQTGVKLTESKTEGAQVVQTNNYPTGFAKNIKIITNDKIVSEASYFENGALQDSRQGASAERQIFDSLGVATHTASLKPFLSKPDILTKLIIGYRETGSNKLYPADTGTRSFNKNQFIQGAFLFFNENRSKGPILKAVFKDGIISGPITGWYQSGSKNVEATVENGILNGDYQRFKEGTDRPYISETGHYSNGILDGLITVFDSPNTKAFEISIKNGVLDGAVTSYSGDTVTEKCQFVNGVRTGNCRIYNTAGKLLVNGTYVAGGRDGKWEEWFENGQPKKLSQYILGKLEGEVLTYASNGQVVKKENYHNNLLDGLASHFNELGKLQANIEYKHNKKDGMATVYFANGKIQQQTPFRNGLKQGQEKRFYDTGEVLAVAEYDQGRQVGMSEEFYKTGVRSGGSGSLRGEQLSYLGK